MIAGDTKKILVKIDEDLSEATVKWGFADVVKSIGEGITLTTEGFEILLDPLDTIGKEYSYRHEAEIVDAQGYVSTVMRGTIYINKDII